MLRSYLFVVLTSLTLLGCTHKALSASAASTENPEENTVTTVLPPAGQTAKLVTVVATQRSTDNGGATPMESEQGMLEVTETDSGRSIEIPLGTTIVLNLTSQPSTGHAWILDEIDHAILVQDGGPQQTAGNNLKGAEESMVWKFKSVGTGVTRLRLIYARAFDQDIPPLKTFDLTITINNR